MLPSHHVPTGTRSHKRVRIQPGTGVQVTKAFFDVLCKHMRAASITIEARSRACVPSRYVPRHMRAGRNVPAIRIAVVRTHIVEGL